MEFFKIVNANISESGIKETLTIESLEQFAPDLFILEKLNENSAKIGGIWGDFTLHRQEINGGLRFSLEECPNALAWTLTTSYPPARDAIVIHMTINRTRKAPEFIEEIHEFLDSHAEALESFFSTTP